MPGQAIERFSFWKPEPLPPKGVRILPIQLLPLGKPRAVLEQLLDIPHMIVDPAPKWDESQAIGLVWQVDDGVVLTVRTECGPPQPGEVLTIHASSAASKQAFFRLYVQVYEQLGATLLDERLHEFLTTHEFRRRLAS